MYIYLLKFIKIYLLKSNNIKTEICKKNKNHNININT